MREEHSKEIRSPRREVLICKKQTNVCVEDDGHCKAHVGQKG